MATIKEQAAVIRDETATGKNTATRVGTILTDIATALEDESTARAAALATETAAREGGDKALRTDIDNNYKILADVVENSIPRLQRAFCDMGEFETERKVLDALGDIYYCSSNANCILHAHYSKAGKECNMVCIQSFNDATVRQFLFNRDKLYQRCIYFTDASRTEIQSRDDWACAFPDRLAWDADGHKYVPSLFGQTFNAQYTDAIPLATSASAGLMTAAQVQTLDSASGEIGAMAYADAAMNAAADAKKGFDDFKVWRAGTDASTLTLKVGSSTTATKYEASFPAATEYNAGLMTAAQVQTLADSGGLTLMECVASAACTITVNGTVHSISARKPYRYTFPAGTAAITSFTLSAAAKSALCVFRLTGRKVKVSGSVLTLYNCPALRRADLSALDTSARTSLESLFGGCPLEKADGLSHFDTSKVTKMTSLFQDCQIKEADLSTWDLSACTNLATLFCQCAKLADAGYISQWDTSKVTTVAQMFYGCAALESLDLSGWDLSSCTALTNIFYGCTALKSLELGAGWGKMPGTPTLDLSPLTAWTGGVKNLLLFPNRSLLGLGKMTIKLTASAYASLQEMGGVTYLTQAGYTVTK